MSETPREEILKTCLPGGRNVFTERSDRCGWRGAHTELGRGNKVLPEKTLIRHKVLRCQKRAKLTLVSGGTTVTADGEDVRGGREKGGRLRREVRRSRRRRRPQSSDE